MALCPKVSSGQRRKSDTAGVSAVEERPHLSVPLHPIGKTHPAGALPRSEHRPHQGKNAGGLNERPRRAIRQMLRVQFVQAGFEIIVHQRDRQLGGALDDPNAQTSQGRAEFRFPLHIEGSNGHTTFLEILLRGPGRQAEARPIGGADATGRAGCWKDIAAVEQSLQGFMDFVGWKILLQVADQLPKALYTLSYCGGECTIELAVEQKLPVLGIEAYDIGREHVDGEIRRKLRHVFAVMLWKLLSVIACHGSVRTPSPRLLHYQARAQASPALEVLDNFATHSVALRMPEACIVWRAPPTRSLAGSTPVKTGRYESRPSRSSKGARV